MLKLSVSVVSFRTEPFRTAPFREGLMPRVIYKDQEGTRRTVTFDRVLTIGRHPDQDVQILDRVVSKEHAVVERVANTTAAFVIHDVGSRNGTVLNGVKVLDRVRIFDGDILLIGSTEILFRNDAISSGVQQTRVEFTERVDDSAVRKRLKETGNKHFLKADEISNVEDLRADYEKLRIANELNQALALEFDLNQLLNRILQKAFEMFDADRGVILLLDRETGEPVPAASKERNSIVSGQEIRISRAILNEVLNERNALLSSDAQMDSRFGGSKSIIIQGVRATMTVPLMYRERLLGLIHLDSQLTSGIFTEKDLTLLGGFANQAGYAIEHSRLVERARQEALARDQLGRLLPQELVDEVMAGRHVIKKGGTATQVSVLFADIRGFTAMCERAPAQNVVALLNEYFEIMVEIIFRHGGTLDKFVGDEIMAVWGAPLEVDRHAERAVEAALEMQAALRGFNRDRESRSLEPLGVGIGVNTGEVVAGYMGSTRAMDYTIVGDVVNVGSRLCSVAAAGEVIISPDVVEATPGRFELQALPPRPLKGKALPMEPFRVLGVKPRTQR
jgi:adenylate cyclase